MIYASAVELKNALTTILQSYELNDVLINQLLSDDFIDGAFELIQNEPENDAFISFIRNFSEEQNLYSIVDAQDKIAAELCKEGYFTNIFQYVINSWKDINLSAGQFMLSNNNDNSRTNNNDSNSPSPQTILDVILEIAGFIPPLKTVVYEAQIYKNIIIKTIQQEQNFLQAMLDEIAKNNTSFHRNIQSNMSTASTTRSPLVVDLDGDGVETTTEEDGVYFDHDNNGFAEKTAWVGKDDGLLVRDINNNGQIDDGTELFGNNTVLSNGQKATNGFEALKDLDSNNNNVFDSSDTAWNQVKVWKDANQNGKVDEEELLTLEQAMGDVRRLFACNVWESVAM